MPQDTHIFQLLLERMGRYYPLQDAVKEVSRYANGSNLRELWLWYIQEHPNIPEELLKALAQCGYWKIQQSVAKRVQDLPEDVLMILAQNRLTMWLIEDRKQNLPEEVLRILTHKKEERVRLLDEMPDLAND